MSSGRKCTKCQKRKTATHFEKNGKKPDGTPRLRSICKECGSGRQAFNPEARTCSVCKKHKDGSEFRRRGRVCRACDNEKVYEYRRGAGREAHNRRMCEYQKERYHNDPEYKQKVAARSAVNTAVRAGVMERPDSCPSCGRKVRVHGHHHNGYEKEHWLDVVWLCARCHYAEDNK